MEPPGRRGGGGGNIGTWARWSLSGKSGERENTGAVILIHPNEKQKCDVQEPEDQQSNKEQSDDEQPKEQADEQPDEQLDK